MIDNPLPLTVLLASPRSFCAGVERAIRAVEDALVRTGKPVYVRHEIVHNGRVVDELRRKGAVFVEELAQIPDGAVAIFSAHGVSRAVEREAAERGFSVLDATCPLVRRVHLEGQRHAKAGREVIVIGHRGHVEIEGTTGQIDGIVHMIDSVAEALTVPVADPERIAYITQTTLSVDDTREIIAALKARFPAIQGPDVKTICYATQNRQLAVRVIAQRAERIIVCGARNSSNTNRLCEVAASPSHSGSERSDAVLHRRCGRDRAHRRRLRARGSGAGGVSPAGALAPAHRGGGLRHPRGRAFCVRRPVTAHRSSSE
jgi:4-hydroxy-3-methylbut-2-enyl diphosphate reductase